MEREETKMKHLVLSWEEFSSILFFAEAGIHTELPAEKIAERIARLREIYNAHRKGAEIIIEG